MIVCHDPKFAFVHVPKTGGSSITAVLGPLVYPDFSTETFGWQTKAHNVGGMHSGLEKLHSKWDPPCFTFGFVRNPFDRMVSYYHALKEEGHRKAQRLVDNMAAAFDFPEFMRFVDTFPKALPPHILRTQHDYLFPKHLKDGVDFVGRYETIESDFKYVCDELTIVATLPHYNTSDHRRYTSYYTPAAREVVEDLFEEDLEEFGYEYGN